jgi:hypothetical protein
MQPDALSEPFASIRPKNASGITSSETMQSDQAIRGDANLVQTCTSDASLRTLR